MRPGPSIEHLTRRLVDTPPDFLAEPRLTGGGEIHVEAVVGDLLEALAGRRPNSGPLRGAFGPASGEARNYYRLVLIACWLLHDEAFLGKGDLAEAAFAWLHLPLRQLAQLAEAELFVRDPDHREEFARLALKALGILPAGETEKQAADRLSALDTVERERLRQRTAEDRQRKQELTQALREKAEREAASKLSRE
ncbi:MAG TPA: hypothetical protein V6D47_20735 [Oscillatoriaceae cyanobacterium]